MAAGPDKPDTGDEEAASGFLSRWSRRKAAAREETPPAEPVTAEPAPEPEDEIDPASLPPVESLTADSDFSLFLRKGVPAAMKTAALRKLWLVEPSVVNYQALVEYNWDFTAPGYGDLLPTDDIAKFARTVFEGTRFEPVPEPATEPAAKAPETQPEGHPALPDAAPEDLLAAADATARVEAPAQPEADTAAPPRRRHGGALPG